MGMPSYNDLRPLVAPNTDQEGKFHGVIFSLGTVGGFSRK